MKESALMRLAFSWGQFVDRISSTRRVADCTEWDGMYKPWKIFGGCNF